MNSRYLFTLLDKHLKTLRQMIFLVGPRQVGKTTIAKALLPKVVEGENYFNWDLREHRKILSDVFYGKRKDIILKYDRLVFDEVHKYKRWKNSLKGLFDVSEPRTHWLVTGSAGLNVYRHGQDSLLGRHFTYHLHPFSVGELLGHRDSVEVSRLFDAFPEVGKAAQTALNNLFVFGGFPEPLFKKDTTFLKQWRQTRLDRLLNQDLAQTENLRNLSVVEELMHLLPGRVGSALSYNSLREDLEVHFTTVKNWVAMLERVFYGYIIKPYSVKKTRLIKKEPKWYLWDLTEVLEDGPRFENLVANHLLKMVHFYRDTQGEELQLHFVKDRAQNEVDFLVTKDRKPWVLVECKLKAQGIPKPLYMFAKGLKVPKAFCVSYEACDYKVKSVDDTEFTEISAARFLASLA